MLVNLTIRDVVLIERLSLDCHEGLCALTGETGAGKSILLDALGLALGARADSGLVRSGASQAVVTATFSVSPDHEVYAVLADQEIEPDDVVIVRRTVSRDGRSRAWVNDQPASVGLLRRVGEALVEVHGQFDTHGLMDPRTHRAVLDAFAGTDRERAAVADAWKTWRRAETDRATAQARIDKARADEDLLRHALAELEALDPQPGEESTLSERRHQLQNRDKLLQTLSATFDALTGDAGADARLGSAMRSLDRVVDIGGPAINQAVDALDRASAELAEAVSLVEGFSETLDDQTDSLETIEERLFGLRDLARKHSVGVDDLPALRDDFADRLTALEDEGDLLQRLDEVAAQARAAYRSAAAHLSDQRARAAEALDVRIKEELPPLKLERARFLTEVAPLDEKDWGPSGADDVAFRVATNAGSPPGPLNKIASGGELARFMLALKVVLAGVGGVPTLVFDEVDSGIGGATAAAVGARLQRLGAVRQVLVVTHSPQVAARADHHWRVSKSVDSDHTATTVSALDPGDRQEEVARMLSGADITDEARAAAGRLIAAGA